MYTKQDVYSMLTENAVWLCTQSKPTEGHEMIYVPSNAVCRPASCREDSLKAKNIQREFSEILHLHGENMSMIPMKHEFEEMVYTQVSKIKPSFVIFEGYTNRPEDEYAFEIELIGQKLLQKGYNIFFSNIEGWKFWHNKSNFRNAVRDVYGEGAIPYGKEWTNPNVDEVIQFVEKYFQQNDNSLIVKIPGAGGSGILKLDRHSNPRVKLGNFLEEGTDWVIVEEWRSWLCSPCTSFFSGSESVYMEMCSQILNSEGGFIGGTSIIPLTDRDKSLLISYQKQIASKIFADGVKGFVGIDTILCSPQKGDSLILPDSGLSVLFIEVNPRINGHNQERKFIWHLANREGVNSENIDHIRTENIPLNVSTREEAWQFFAQVLEGVATPIPKEAPLKEGEVYFVIDVNCGKPSKYDAVMLLGLNAQKNLKKAHQVLNDKNLLR